jgi:gamma-glutamyltranspeptidase/glutathione hydrolase
VSARVFANGCVASPHYLASEAGLDVLARGGNALDAALAVNLTLGVVAPYLCGFGGDLFAIVWDGARAHGYNGSGRASARATPEAMRAAAAGAAAAARPGGARIPARGPHSVTVPGAVEAWFALLERFGSRSFGDLAARALAYARDGFELSARGAFDVAGAVRAAEADDAMRALYEGHDAGATLRQPALARTIEALAADGPAAYYGGPIGAAIADRLADEGALLDARDIAAHTGDWVEPLRARFRDVEVLELPPNTQGVAVLEALRILDGFARPTEHQRVEAVKLALSDLAAHVTDPEHMAIDARALYADEHAAERRARIDPAAPGAPPPWPVPGGGTAYMCAADRDGMIVSLIQSNYTGFGSGVHVPEFGINLHSRGAFFSLDARDANVVAPRKRTLHTLIPALALREEEPWLAFGTMAGQGQAQNHVQLLARMIDEGLDPQEAIDHPRWFCSPDDWHVDVEPGHAATPELRARGHHVRELDARSDLLGHMHAIEALPGGGYACASDPRAEGAALGLP